MEGAFFHHVMLRIKDPSKSIPFYVDKIGMTLVQKRDFPDNKFSLYFLAFVDPKTVPAASASEKEKRDYLFSHNPVLELTHNYGTENEEGPVYHNGNADPRGYGHIALVVKDVPAACEHLDKLGVEFQKRPNEGRMSSIAFVKDPDNYWIELVQSHKPVV